MKKIIVSALLAALMVIALAVPAFAYQSALPSGVEFSQAAKDKMAAFRDGDNIFAIGSFDTATYPSPADYNKSGNCQFCYQNNSDKWGRAIKDAGWTINGMAAIGDGVIDCANVKSPGTGVNFSRKGDKIVDANANEVTENGYYILCGWEFAADFKIKGFKTYFNKEAVADDFDILVGKLDGDNIVWEVAYSAENVSTKLTDAAGCTNPIGYFGADFAKTMEGRFIQIAVKGTDGLATPSDKAGYLGFTMSEIEAYWGEVKTSGTTEAGGTTKAPETTKPASPSTGDTTINYYVVVAIVIALAASAVVIGKRRVND
ncbi:MAG: LPXTG cell wall anchor domain-containing protein [Clostridia bacterium]|nr:LPXTG cell wall anchor domain-containing protein [Clostridia bacterium]